MYNDNLDVTGIGKVITIKKLVDEYEQAIFRISLTPEAEQMIKTQMASISNSFYNNVIKQFTWQPFEEYFSQQNKMLYEALANFGDIVKTSLCGVISIESIKHAHKSWFAEIQKNLTGQMQLEMSMRTSVSQVVSQLALINDLGHDRDLMFTASAMVSSAHANRLNSNISSMLEAYIALTNSYKDSIRNIINHPKDMFEGTNRELFTSIGMIYESKTMLNREETPRKMVYADFELSLELPSVVDLLNKVDRSLSNMLIGAYQSLKSDNIDKARQVLVSLRELVKHTLNLLISESQVNEWLTSRGDSPTKRKPLFKEKVLYMIEMLPDDDYGKFAKGDITAKLEILDVLNGLHKRELHYNNDGLHCIMHSVVSLLCYLVTIYKNYCNMR